MQCSAAASLTTPVARQAAPRMQQRLAGAGGALQVRQIRPIKTRPLAGRRAGCLIHLDCNRGDGLQVAGVRVAHRRAGRAAALGRPASMSGEQ